MPPRRQYGLSKSRISMFEQCPKRLWPSVHRPELAQPDEGSEARFATGHEVGAIARALLPDGVMIEADPDLSAALAATEALLESGHNRPIFEATLEHDGVLVRIDVLEPDGSGGWRLAEVKSSTQAKDFHLGDLATQLWVTHRSRVRVRSAAIRHIDNSFVLKREGEFDGLFADTELIAAAAPIVENRVEVVTSARETLAGAKPDIAPGSQCDTPFFCEFTSHCHSALPPGPQWPVSVLPHGGGKRWLEQGIDDLLAVDPNQLKSAVHKRVWQATQSGEIYHDVDGARAAMAGWAFPRAWLDFETIGFAVPRWIGTRPYQQVPFQFSVHLNKGGGVLEHLEFLSLEGTDPRRRCAEALVAAVPAAGAVIAYNASFERGRILELAAVFPDLADGLHAIVNRIFDLLPVVRANWYHRDQRGSWSIKAVLPTIAADLDYSGLEVKDGSSAQEAYAEALKPETTDARRAELAVALRAYCKRDTEAMVILARRLETNVLKAL